MIEWMGAIGRSGDITKENISSKHFVKVLNYVYMNTI